MFELHNVTTLKSADDNLAILIVVSSTGEACGLICPCERRESYRAGTRRLRADMQERMRYKCIEKTLFESGVLDSGSVAATRA